MTTDAETVEKDVKKYSCVIAAFDDFNKHFLNFCLVCLVQIIFSSQKTVCNTARQQSSAPSVRNANCATLSLICAQPED